MCLFYEEIELVVVFCSIRTYIYISDSFNEAFQFYYRNSDLCISDYVLKL